MWHPEPWQIFKPRIAGLGDMATLSDTHPSPAFSMPTAYVLVYIRAWFTGGSGSADLTINQRIYHADATWWDNPLRVLLDGGTGGNAFLDFRVQADELYHWSFGPEIKIVPTWTNPDSGNMRWAIEAGLSPLPEEMLR